MIVKLIIFSLKSFNFQEKSKKKCLSYCPKTQDDIIKLLFFPNQHLQ